MNASKARRAATARAGKNRAKKLGHPTTAEMNYSKQEEEFMFAMHEFKRVTGRQFPTWSETLRVLNGLGYRKVEGGA
jgi:uncharacterized cupin superfamily protein